MRSRKGGIPIDVTERVDNPQDVDASPLSNDAPERADDNTDSTSRHSTRTQIYTAQYRERIVLADGRLAEFRLLKASDKKRLRRFFETLSERSRTARFLKHRDSIPDDELATLVQASSRTHLAIGLFAQRFYFFDHDLLASAHFACLDSCEDTAEIVVCAADSVQGQGLGHVLMRRLSEAAVERGVRIFTLSMLSRNNAARALFSSIGYAVRFERAGELTHGEIDLLPPLPSEPETPGEKPRRRFMRWARARQRRDSTEK